MSNDAAHKRRLTIPVVMDVADLDDAEVAEGVGEVVDRNRTRDNADLVTGDFGGIESQAARRSERRADQKLAARKESLVVPSHRVIGNISGHSP